RAESGREALPPLAPGSRHRFHFRREGSFMRRIGILSFSSPGHYYPITALARRLQARGHHVVYFQVADLESPIRAAGLEFRQIGRDDFPLGALRARDEELG